MINPHNLAKINQFNVLHELPNTTKMPVLFLGHGSPMNAITHNEFTQNLNNLATRFPKPTAILCISAHWLANGSWITAMNTPKTIHDFSGFPRQLNEFQYPAAGSPLLAQTTYDILTQADYTAHLDQHEWGLDHGTWSVLTHLYPKANVPVVQLSLDYFKTPEQHYRLAKQLAILRNKGVLIVGSGNVVHNLLKIRYSNEDYAYDWALATDEKIKQFINTANHQALIDYHLQGTGFELAIPTNEHYLPLLYILALQKNKDNIMIFNKKITYGSISMTSVAIGL